MIPLWIVCLLSGMLKILKNNCGKIVVTLGAEIDNAWANHIGIIIKKIRHERYGQHCYWLYCPTVIHVDGITPINGGLVEFREILIKIL